MADKHGRKELAVVDIATGETIDIISEGESYKKIRRYDFDLSREYFDFAHWGYSKLSEPALRVLSSKKLLTIDWSLLWYLCGKVRYRTSEIRHKNGKRLRTDLIAKELNVSNSTINRSLKTLEKEGFIFKETDRPLTIYMNPYFLMKGNAIPKEVVAFFYKTDFQKAAKGEGK